MTISIISALARGRRAPVKPQLEGLAMKQLDASGFAEFDRLPDAAYVRMPVVSALFSVSPATIWRWSRMGTLPRPTRISGVTLWNAGQLRRSIQTAQQGRS
jgi:predicted DNA-binding transcriptional regulator AlpA